MEKKRLHLDMPIIESTNSSISYKMEGSFIGLEINGLDQNQVNVNLAGLQAEWKKHLHSFDAIVWESFKKK